MKDRINVFRNENQDDNALTMMLGAICGDTAGSTYEHHNIKYCPEKENIIRKYSRFTDDSVMTCAVADGIANALKQMEYDKNHENDKELFYVTVQRSVMKSMAKFGRQHPFAGYGASFARWIVSKNPKPYNSWGNGSAMRVSYAGWIATSLEEAEFFAELSAEVTHNHPEGIKGAKVVAGCIYLSRTGAIKEDIRKYVSKYYDIDFTLDEIRPTYRFDVSCQGSVPQAIVAFLEGEDFIDVIAKAISIGGDSDTIAAIAGSIAETIYPIPYFFRNAVIEKLEEDLQQPLDEAIEFCKHYHETVGDCTE